jgi:hypothetical protein
MCATRKVAVPVTVMIDWVLVGLQDLGYHPTNSKRDSSVRGSGPTVSAENALEF